MEHIVDPSWVYWMDIADVLKVMSLVIGGSGCVILLISLPIAYFDAVDGCWKEVKPWAVPLIIVSAFFLLAGIFIPSKETLITMKVAELATKENVTLTAQQLKEIVDYIINAMKELK